MARQQEKNEKSGTLLLLILNVVNVNVFIFKDLIKIIYVKMIIP